jgi:hypothetical protein
MRRRPAESMRTEVKTQLHRTNALFPTATVRKQFSLKAQLKL